MEQIFVKPAKPGMKVRKLVNGYLAEGGELVNAEGYWLRRIADGDVVGAEAPTEAPDAAVATELRSRTKSA